MKKTLLILSSALMLLPALLIFAFCIDYTWQPTAYLVSFPRLFSLLIISISGLFLLHFYFLKKEDHILLKRSAFWIWLGPGLILFLPLAYWRQKLLCKKSKVMNAYFYFLSDGLCLALYIICIISLTLLNYSPVTDKMLFQYKKKHISKGLMYYKENWGWVDKIHYRPDHFNEILHALEDNKTEVTLNDGWITPLRFPVTYKCTYTFTAAPTALEQWAQATAMSTHFMALNERVQEESPWYHGNQLSAWQFDDLSSGLLACLELCPDEKLRPQGKELKDTQEILKIWSREGQVQVKIKMDLDQSWALANQPQARKVVEKAPWQIKELIIRH
ncbi:hypothetical protein PQO03_03660 [Lentisphaera profundi]|uniref:Uncharacterized protein n=1 Tax=Lentisphaera profundi TaxID=1658616 RepID=A0ABY7VT20_9BACT|nr:hypothetical protein [Lentisphaera profundi]WDE97051.1 hypothetical protein PQO03_03660 [Lentisphaera profundi]